MDRKIKKKRKKKDILAIIVIGIVYIVALSIVFEDQIITARNYIVDGDKRIQSIVEQAKIKDINLSKFDLNKTYDPETETITIFADGEEVAKLKLLTDRNLKVIDKGEGVLQKVAEFSIETRFKIPNAFKQINFYNADDMGDTTKDFTWRYKIQNGTWLHEIEQKYCDNFTAPNDTIYEWCWFENTANESLPKYDFIDLEDAKLNELNAGNITIGIFTDVRPGEFIEWQPVLFDERLTITEWATWGESLNDNLVFFWDLNEASGNATDISDGEYNGTVSGATQGETECILDDCYSFDGTNDEVMAQKNATVLNKNFSVSFWANATDGTFELFFQTGWHVGGATANYIRISSSNYNIGYSGGSGSFGSAAGDLDEWHHHVVTYNESGTVFEWWKDGVSLTTDSKNQNTVNAPPKIGADSQSGTDYNGFLDEVGMWDRQLTSSEISDLYNGGTGITCCGGAADPGLSPNVSLVSPPNGNVTARGFVNLTCNATEDILLKNASTYIYNSSGDNINITTNTITGTFNTSTVEYNFSTEGEYEWNCLVFDDNGNSSWASANWSIVINTLYTWNGTLSNSLFAYYKLNETSGNATDSVGDRDGLLFGGPTRDIGGIINNSYGFDDVDDYVSLGNDTEFGADNNSFSISAWAKMACVNCGLGNGDVVNRWFNHTAGWKTFSIYNEQLTTRRWAFVVINNSGATTGAAEYVFSAIADVWYHVVGVYNGTTELLYVNGTLRDTDDVPVGLNDNLDINLTIGGSPQIDDDLFNGSIDEVAFWTRALTADEVEQLYNSGMGVSFAEPEDSCTYLTGDWDVDCSDNCSITDNVNLIDNSDIILNGSGSFTVSGANITGWQDLRVRNSCVAVVTDGGSLI